MIDLLAAFDHAFAHHPITGIEAADGLAGLDYFSRPFVAWDYWIVDGDDVLAAIEFVVRMADADRAHAHKHFIRSDRRRGQVLDLKFARLVDHQCLHISSPLNGRRRARHATLTSTFIWLPVGSSRVLNPFSTTLSAAI